MPDHDATQAAMRELREQQADLNDRVLALQADLGTLRDDLLRLWEHGQVPYDLDSLTLAEAQALHAGRLAELKRLRQALREAVDPC